MFDKFGVAGNPAMLGRVLAFVGTVSYVGAAGAYYIAGKHYFAFKRQVKYRSLFAKNRNKRGYDSKGFKAESLKPDYEI